MTAHRQSWEDRAHQGRLLIDAAPDEMKHLIAWAMRDYYASLANSCFPDAFCPNTGLNKQELTAVAQALHEFMDSLPRPRVPFVVNNLALSLGSVRLMGNHSISELRRGPMKNEPDARTVTSELPDPGPGIEIDPVQQGTESEAPNTRPSIGYGQEFIKPRNPVREPDESVDTEQQGGN